LNSCGETMVDEAYTVPSASCDNCGRKGLKLYHRYRDGDVWLCRTCVNRK
jgi:ribosomal protein L37AE/L43A